MSAIDRNPVMLGNQPQTMGQQSLDVALQLAQDGIPIDQGGPGLGIDTVSVLPKSPLAASGPRAITCPVPDTR